MAAVCELSVTVIVLTEYGATAMWWVEQAEKDAERKRNRRNREKRARQLKDYCTAIVGESVSCAETLLDRAVQMHDLKAA